MPHCGIPLPPFPPAPKLFLRSLMEVAPQSGRGIFDEEEDREEEEEEIESASSFYEEDDDDDSSVDRELTEDAATTSSASSNSLCPLSTSSSPGDQLEEGPLFEMSSLFSLLPVKRGLSKHFDGKSQSFTSLASVRSLEDLAKPERPCKKRLKSCRSFGESLGCHRAPSSKVRTASKKASPLLNPRRQRILGHRPPMYPQAASRLSAGNTFPFLFA